MELARSERVPPSPPLERREATNSRSNRIGASQSATAYDQAMFARYSRPLHFPTMSDAAVVENASKRSRRRSASPFVAYDQRRFDMPWGVNSDFLSIATSASRSNRPRWGTAAVAYAHATLDTACSSKSAIAPCLLLPSLSAM